MKQEDDRQSGGGVGYDETRDERQNRREGERKTKWGEVRGEGPVTEEGVLGTLCTGDQ